MVKQGSSRDIFNPNEVSNGVAGEHPSSQSTPVDYPETGRAETVADFVRLILELKDVPERAFAIAGEPARAPEGRKPGLWFRGQARGAPVLAPTVLRDWFVERICGGETADRQSIEERLSQAELQLNRTFRRLGASLLPAAASLVDIYFLAQHHGMPTRLLDWTTNPLAALFFAVTSQLDHDGIVLATVPDWRLTAASPDDPLSAYVKGAPFDVRTELVVKTISNLFGETSELVPGIILPVVPDLHAGRMLQQGSCFTLHMPGSKPIPPGVVARITVPHDRKVQLENELRSLGITWATLFPDLDHLSHEIRSQWNLWPVERG